MRSLRDVIIFLAGFEFFHTISHIFLNYFIVLPLNLEFMVLTPTLNMWAIFINAAITLALLGLAIKLKR